EVGLFISDSWRWKPSITLNAGLRWQIQTPFQPDADSYTMLPDYRMVYGVTGEGNLFKPGVMQNGIEPELVPYKKGSRAYNMDWNNLAPSIGAVWQPTLSQGVLSKILGPEPVFRGGYSIAYEAPGFSGFTSIF